MRITSAAPGNCADAASFAISACCSPSAQAMFSSGVDTASGSASSTRRRIGVPREDLEQPRAGVEPVVEAVPALPEERVAAHLAGQRGAGLLHLAP